jgi:DNA-binding NarL/FixJ family response regulator
MAMGASDYIIKPMTWDDYVDAIRGAVERWIPPRAA